MLADIFKTVIILSATGSVLMAALALFSPLTKRYFSAQWNYYIWVAVLAVMVLPVSIPASEAIKPNINMVSEGVRTIGASHMTGFDWNVVLEAAGTVWLFAAVVIALVRIASYIGFADLLLNNSVFEREENGVHIYRTDIVDAPLVIGVFQSRLFIPMSTSESVELDYIMAHELTHCHRNDVAVKWFAMLVCTVHWFNPFSYLLLKRIDEECEISCDVAVTSGMTEEEKAGYMRTVLKMVSETRGPAVYLTTKMSGGKNTLIHRFKRIKESKNGKKKVIVFSVVIGALCIAAALTVIGIINGRMNREQKESESPIVSVGDASTPEPVKDSTSDLKEYENTEQAPSALPEQNISVNDSASDLKEYENTEQTQSALHKQSISTDSSKPAKKKPKKNTDANTNMQYSAAPQTETTPVPPPEAAPAAELKKGASQDEVERQLNAMYTTKIDDAGGRMTVHYWQSGNEQISVKYDNGILQSAEVIGISDDTRKFYEESTTKRTYKLVPTKEGKEPVISVISHSDDSGKGDETYVQDGEFVEVVEKNVPSSMTVKRASNGDSLYGSGRLSGAR